MLATRQLIDASPAILWDLLTDTEAWPRWGPSVSAVDCASRRIGPGARGRVRTVFGVWLPFEVTHWTPGRYWQWRVGGIPATGHEVTAVAGSRCEVIFTVPAWAPFYLPVCASAIRRLQRLAGERPNSRR